MFDINGNKIPLSPAKPEYFSAKKRYSRSNPELNNLEQYACFIHVTDVHGDSVRLNTALDFADDIGATAVIHTGDAVAYYGADDFTFFSNAVNTHTTKFYNVIGNHDVNGQNSVSAVHSKFIAPFIDANGYTVGTSGENYYYHDFLSYKIRLIVLNQYQAYNNSMSVKYLEPQITWLESTLNSTPSDYGVIIAMHIPEAGVTYSEDYHTFWMDTDGRETTTKVISKVVDAFMSRTTASVAFDGFTKSVDFTSATAEFICFINGHNHKDSIGYMDSVNTQLCLGSICTCVWTNRNRDLTPGTGYPYYNEVNDMGRLEGTESEDAFNMYIIDTQNKKIRIVRIGANVTNNMQERKYLSIPYA